MSSPSCWSCKQIRSRYGARIAAGETFHCARCHAVHGGKASPRDADPTDYYEILQVSPNADPDVIHAAYKRLALKYHPDRNTEPDATRKMQLLNDAYEMLSDPDRRRAYNQARDRSSGSRGAKPHTPPAGASATEYLRELSRYVNDLLDRDVPLATVAGKIRSLVPDQQIADVVLAALLTERVATTFRVSSSARPTSTEEQQRRVSGQLAEYIVLLLDRGESAETITPKLLDMGLDQELASKLLIIAQSRRAHPFPAGSVPKTGPREVDQRQRELITAAGYGALGAGGGAIVAVIIYLIVGVFIYLFRGEWIEARKILGTGIVGSVIGTLLTTGARANEWELSVRWEHSVLPHWLLVGVACIVGLAIAALLIGCSIWFFP